MTVYIHCQEEEEKMIKGASFDFKELMYPKKTIITQNAAVISKNFIKLIPAVYQRAGTIK